MATNIKGSLVRRISGGRLQKPLTRRKSSHLAQADTSPLPQHPGALSEQSSDEVAASQSPHSWALSQRASSLDDNAEDVDLVRPPAVVDARLAPEWWVASMEAAPDGERDGMQHIFDKLLLDASTSTSAAMKQFRLAVADISSGSKSARQAADELCRMAANINPKYVLALEHAVATGSMATVAVATAKAVALVPYAAVRRDDVWCDTCFGAWRSGLAKASNESLLEGMTECCWAELVTLCTSYMPLADTEANGKLLNEIVRLAFDNATRHATAYVRLGPLKPNTPTEALADACRELAAEQWAAALGNATPERTATVLAEFERRCSDLRQLEPPLFRSLRHIRIDIANDAANRQLKQTVDALVAALDSYLTANPENAAAKLHDEAAAVACARCLEGLLRATNFEALRLASSQDTSPRVSSSALKPLDGTLLALFKKLDEVWAPRKATTSSHPRLTRDMSLTLVSLMVTVFVRLPRDAYDANLELFVSKRLQKPAMDKKDAPRALINLANFLRGPRWRGNQARPALSRWPRPPRPFAGVRGDDDANATDKSSTGSLSSQSPGLQRQRIAATTQAMLSRERPRTMGGIRPSDHAFSCCMPAFGPGAALFRPEVLTWIREKTFQVGGHYKCADCAANARLAADVVLAMLANSFTTGLVRAMLDCGDGISKGTKSTDRLERYVVGLRVVAVLLDERSGFTKHALHTRANAALPDGSFMKIQTDVRSYFIAAASEQLRRSLDSVAQETFAQINRGYDADAGAPHSILDVIVESDLAEVTDGARYDARRSVSDDTVSATKLLHLQVIQETCRCAPFVPWKALGRALLDAGVLHHGAPCVRRSLRVALQRLVLDRPTDRLDVVCDAFAHAGSCLTDGTQERVPALKVCVQLLALWHRVIRDRADNWCRAAASNVEAVLEFDVNALRKLDWSARIEAIALAYLADDNAVARDIALDVLDEISAVRASQLLLVDMIFRAKPMLFVQAADGARTHSGDKDGIAVPKCDDAFLDSSSRNMTIRELLAVDGVENDIAKRAIRAFVDKTSGTSSGGSGSLASSAPTLRKMSKMSNELWYGALPLLAAASSMRGGNAALAGHTQQLLYSALRHRNASRNAPERFEAQLSLLLALHCEGGNELAKFLTATAWPLLEGCVGGSEVVTAPTLNSNKSMCARLCSCCRSASARAVHPIVTSLLNWLHKVEKPNEKKASRTLRRGAVWALVRSTVESPNFKEAASADRSLVMLLAGACVSEAFLDPSTTSSQSVLDRTFLIDAIADAIVDAHVAKAASRGPTGKAAAERHADLASTPGAAASAMPRWAPPELAKLYDFLRATHIWPRPAGPLETKWGVALVKTALAASHDDQPCTTNKGVADNDGICLAISGRAVAKLFTMGAFLPAKTIDALLDEASPPKDLTWFLTAEKLGPTARCLPWLLGYHAETLAPAFVRRAVSAPKEGAIPFFHAIADQLLPAASLPVPPAHFADVDASSAYFASVIRFGIDSDLAQLSLGDAADKGCEPQRAPAVSFAAVFDDDRFVAGRPERLGANSVLLLGLRAMRDSDVSIRVRAYLLVRNVTLHILDQHNSPLDVDLRAATRSDFIQLMSSYWVIFSTECSSRRDAEANAILECVATCVGAVGDVAVHNLLSEIFGPHLRNRDEWGGAATTARILGALCKHVVLADEGGEGFASARGREILSWLIHFCGKNLAESEALWTALCAPGGRGGVRNVRAIVLYVRRAAARAARANKRLTLAACQSAALACYVADPSLTARVLTEPFSFEAHERAVDAARGMVSAFDPLRNAPPAAETDLNDDALVDACGAVALISALGGVDPTYLMPYLHVVVHFCIVHFASPTRFGGGAHSLSADFAERSRIPQLLHTIILNLQPLFLASEAKKAASSLVASRVNSILAFLRAGIDSNFLEFDWSRPVTALSDPTYWCSATDDAALDAALSTSAWVMAVPPLEVASGAGGLVSPVALVRALCEVLEAVSSPSGELSGAFVRQWGREALRWALTSRDFPTKLKAYVVYLALEAPEVRSWLPVVLDALASLHSELSTSDSYHEPETSSETQALAMPTTGVTSTAHYQAASCCCALLRVAGAAVFAESSTSSSTWIVEDRLFWVADAVLRTRCVDEVRCRVYRYGVVLLRALVARMLGHSTTSVGSLAERLARSAPNIAPNAVPLTRSPLLEATARLAAGLLCGDAATSSDARAAVAPLLSRVAPADAPSKKESRTTYAFILAALAPWFISRAGSSDAVDAATAFARAAKDGVGDGGYLGSSIEDHLVHTRPPNAAAFAQRCAAWLANAAASTADPSRFLRRVDAALAAAATSETTSASDFSSRCLSIPPRARASPTSAAALWIATELLVRDDGGPDALLHRARSLPAISAVAFAVFSKTASALDKDLDNEQRTAATALVTVIVGSLGVQEALLDTADSPPADNDLLGYDDAHISARLRAIARDTDTTDDEGPVESLVQPAPTLDERRVSSNRARLRDDPRWAPYAHFVDLVHQGVPFGAVRLRAQAEGLDPEILLLDPDKPPPLSIFENSHPQ